MGIYAGKSDSLDNLPDGASVAVPKDATNEGRALLLLEAQGLIKLASTILNLVSSVQGGGELMDNTSSFTVDEGVAKIRVPYATYTCLLYTSRCV